jgi:hypothetical protein
MVTTNLTNTMQTAMKTPIESHYTYQLETIAEANRIPVGTVSHNAHMMGMRNCEPLIVMMDCLIRYAKAYKARFGSPLASDTVLGDEWLSAAKGVRGLLNGDGSIAMFREINTDSKDNGAVESMFWNAMALAGFKESDL